MIYSDGTPTKPEPNPESYESMLQLFTETSSTINESPHKPECSPGLKEIEDLDQTLELLTKVLISIGAKRSAVLVLSAFASEIGAERCAKAYCAGSTKDYISPTEATNEVMKLSPKARNTYLGCVMWVMAANS